VVKYALLIYGSSEDVSRFSEEERRAMYRDYFAVDESPGVSAGTELQSVATAKTIRVENGRTVVSDGPFLAAREHLVGFFLLEADTFDDAAEMAARIQAAPHWRGDRGAPGRGALSVAAGGLS
jgi:hypothetical protein